MTTNAFNATIMLLGFDQIFFCFAELHFAINPRAGSILKLHKYSRIGLENIILEYLIILKSPSLTIFTIML